MALTYVNQVAAPEGINQAMPGSTIPDTCVRWAQDALFDRVGTIRRRGPFTEVDLYTASTGVISQPTTSVTKTQRVLGMMTTQDPVGNRVIALVVHDTNIGTGGVKIYFYDSEYRNIGSTVLKLFVVGVTDNNLLCTDNVIFISTPVLGGGVYFSIINRYHTASASNVMASYYWAGGIGSDMEPNATISATFSLDSAAVGPFSTYGDTITKTTGNWDTSVIKPGMFVMDVLGGNTSYYLGIVKTVSDSTITLTKKILRTSLTAVQNADGNYLARTIRFTNTRPYIHNHGRGLLTSATPAVNGTFTSGNEGGAGEGHWKSADLDSSYALYRASDNTWIGNIATIVNNASGTFSATHVNTALTNGITNGQYVAYKINTSVFTSLVVNRTGQNYAGVFSASYQGYQWYANAGILDKHNRIVFSADHNFESVDLSRTAADSIELPSRGEIRGIASSSAGLLIFLEDKTYIIRGNERSNFSLEELYPEGTLCSTSIVEYGGGVFWVSKSGFLLYDGGSVRLLTKDNLGVYYTDSIRTFDPLVDRVYSFFYKNYLFVHFTKFNSVFKPQRYEPVYVTNWTSSGNLSLLPYARLDNAFVWNDFSPDNKIPVYWDSQNMYGILSTEISGIPSTFGGADYAVTAVSGAAGTATLTIGTHPFIVGNQVVVNGVTPVGYNGTYVITAIAATTISYANTTTGSIGFVSGVGKVALNSNAFYGDLYRFTDALGKINPSDSMVFALYLPTQSVTTLSNMNFFGAASIETSKGVTCLFGVNRDIELSTEVNARIINIDPVLDTNTNGVDPILIYNPAKSSALYRKGPDFFVQTKSYTVGDPVLKKWFQRLMFNMKLNSGSVRVDLVTDEDQDDIDISLKAHKNWEMFTVKGYSWLYAQNIIFPKYNQSNTSTWQDVTNQQKDWIDLLDPAFERFKKRFSWRSNSVGLRIYQMNSYEPPHTPYGNVELPNTVEISSWDIGFKPMREGRL